jgi:hypothetical protein
MRSLSGSLISGFGLSLLFTLGCGSENAEQTPAGAGSPTTWADAPDGAERATFVLDTFELEAGGEVYKCQNFVNPSGRDVAILQSQSAMSAGSHHLAVFRYDENTNGELEDCSGLEFHQTLHAAQTKTARTTYPAGVGVYLKAIDGIRLNAHYYNTSGATIRPKIEIVLDYVDADAVEHMAAQIYMNDSTLDIPPGRGKGGGTLAIPSEVGAIRIISAQSHMHRRAVGFESRLEDGTLLYETESWNEPPVKVFSPAVELLPGSPLTWSCDYQNETAGHLKFGESADTDEMCVLTGFYYPAPEGMTLVGDLSLGNMFLTR